jgi:hypothetical protein
VSVPVANWHQFIRGGVLSLQFRCPCDLGIKLKFEKSLSKVLATGLCVCVVAPLTGKMRVPPS